MNSSKELRETGRNRASFRKSDTIAVNLYVRRTLNLRTPELLGRSDYLCSSRDVKIGLNASLQNHPRSSASRLPELWSRRSPNPSLP